MSSNPDHRIASQEKLQMSRYLLHHQGGYRAGNIYLCAEEAARQAFINVVAACGDVSRVVNRCVALIAIDRTGEVADGMYMKRSKQHHRHIYQQDDPGKQLLPESDAVM